MKKKYSVSWLGLAALIIVSFGTPAGVNFGWPCREGRHDFDFTGTCANATLIDQIVEYGHDAEGSRSVTRGVLFTVGWLILLCKVAISTLIMSLVEFGA